MRLVACPACHTQYDVSGVDAPVFDCRCGAQVRNETGAAVDAAVQRCSACGALLPPDASQCEYCHSAVAAGQGRESLICPECFARNDEQARFCRACGVAFQPEPLPRQGETPEKPLACPCCQEPMSPRGLGGVWIRECARCSGLWVPGEKLDTLIHRAVETARERAASGMNTAPPRPRRVAAEFTYRHCPVCGAQMYRKNFGHHSGVIVDWCGAHGTWLDKDELEEIARFVAEGGLDGGEKGIVRGGRTTEEDFNSVAAAIRMRELELQRMRSRGVFAQPSASTGILSILERLADLLS
jgi:Zn-finger nucleic acid-binding protein/ribosomal protein L40E